MKQFYIYSTLFLLLVSLDANSKAGLKPFYTDGCTMFVDQNNDNSKNWRHCCVNHDLRYWFGGESKDKDISDLDLKACVTEAANEKLANLMYKAIRLGNLSPIKHKTHWGWGWYTKMKKNAPLTDDQKNIVKVELKKLDLTNEKIDIDLFIDRYLTE